MSKWWDKSITLVEGCTPVSEGCKHCWSADMTHRFRPEYTTPGKPYYRFNGKIICREDRLDEILRRKKPTRWTIWNDLFHPSVPFEFIDKVHAAMIMAYRKGHYHTYQVLTKRPNRMLEYYSSNRRPQLYKILEKDYDEITGFYGINWPLPCLWLGVTAENQEMADKRIPILLQIPAAVRFVSIEPMLGRIKVNHIKSPERTLNALKGKSKYYIDGNTPYYGHFLNWVIVGCESIQGKVGRLHIPEILNNPMSGVKISAENIWRRQAIDIVNQCKAAGVPVFVKQIPLNGKVCKDITKFPKELQIRQYPKACDEA